MNKLLVMRIVDINAGRMALPCKPCFLEAYNPDGLPGEPEGTHALLTGDPDSALRFPSLEALMRLWKAQSTVVPLRPDGKPNRPLTACSIEPMWTEEARALWRAERRKQRASTG